MKKMFGHGKLIAIDVDTLPLEELLHLVKGAQDFDNVIDRTDCKTRNGGIMESSMNILADHRRGRRGACAPESTREGSLAMRAEGRKRTNAASNRPV